MPVDPVSRKQFLMRAFLRDTTAVKYDDTIRVHQCRDPVRDQNDRHAACLFSQRFPDPGIGFRIHRGQRVIQDQHIRIADECLRDRGTLLLSAGKRDAAFPDKGFIALRERVDRVIECRDPRRFTESTVNPTTRGLTSSTKPSNVAETALNTKYRLLPRKNQSSIFVLFSKRTAGIVPPLFSGTLPFIRHSVYHVSYPLAFFHTVA